MSRVSIKGIFIGGIVDVGSSLFFGVILTLAALARIDRVRTPPDQLGPALNAIMRGPLCMTLTMLTGVIMSILGGYIAARIAKHDHLLNGLLSAWLCTLIGIGTILLKPQAQPLLFDILDFILCPAAALLGGYLCLRQQRQGSPSVAAG